jgi:CHAT domain-containing protein
MMMRNHSTHTTAIRRLAVLAIGSLTLLAPPARTFADGPLSAPVGEPVDVREGYTEEREIAAGQAQEYRVAVSPGTFFHADVDQHGIDVSVTLIGPAGETLDEIDSLTGPVGAESVSVVADAAGTYRFVVHVGEEAAPASGTYAVKGVILRPATSQDRSRVAAERDVHAAVQLENEGTVEERRAQLVKYRDALGLWQKAADRRGEADTLSSLGDVQGNLGLRQEALDSFRQEIALREALHDDKNLAVALNNSAVQIAYLGQSREAIAIHERARELARKIHDAGLEGQSLVGLAYAQVGAGDRRTARATFTEALSLLREHGKPLDVARALLGLGKIAYQEGDRAAALDSYTQAETIIQGDAGEDHAAETSGALCGQAAVYADRGEQERAIDLYRRAIDISEKAGDTQGLVTGYDGLGYAYHLLGDKPDAVANHTKALDLARETRDRAEQARVLINRSVAEMSGDRRAGEYLRATKDLTQALAIYQKAGDPRGQAAALVNLGKAAVARRQFRTALGYLGPALRAAQASGSTPIEIEALKYTGDAYAGQRAWRAAFEKYDAALPLASAFGIAGGDAVVLLAMARAERDRGQLDAALERIEAAIAKIEARRSQINSKDLRAGFFEEVRVYYDVYIDLLMRLHRKTPDAGYDRKALEASERAHARSLLELIAEAKVSSTRIAELGDAIDAKTSALAQLPRKDGDDREVAELRQDLEQLYAERDRALAEARSQSPRYAELTQPTTLSCEQIQTQVLDSGTALVEYWLGETASYVWVVTPDSVRAVQLPKRTIIEAATRQLYTVMSHPPGAPTRRLELSGDPATDARRRATEARLPRSYQAAAAPLTRMLLAPVWNDLGTRRLLVVGDGALHYLPFGSLPVVATGASEPKPLIVDREVVCAPSASIVSVLRQENAGRTRPAKQIAVFADPVFDASDERVVSAGKVAANDREAGAETPDEVERRLELAQVNQAANDTGGEKSHRLRSTRVEAEAIRTLAGSESSVALDFAANREAAMNGDLENYRIIHFATHGYLDTKNPKLSGLVLSLCDEKGVPKLGFVSTPTVFGMKLNADLVVLSACETGLGQEVRGEGVVGLTRAFMYAGSPRVIVSMWEVDDRATAELMKRFYAEMLERGETPAAALRAAQIATWQQEGWRAPFYWAPFVLQGDWR